MGGGFGGGKRLQQYTVTVLSHVHSEVSTVSRFLRVGDHGLQKGCRLRATMLLLLLPHIHILVHTRQN